MPKYLPLKLLLTLLVTIAIAAPFFLPDLNGGILSEVKLLGPLFGPLFVVSFLITVAFYAFDLQRLLQAIPKASRTTHPYSVWWMFLVPYNFVEDFFIINNITRSLKAHAVADAQTDLGPSYGAVTGFGWCTLQIISLVPHYIGSVAGALAVVLWMAHWRFVRRAVKNLQAKTAANI